MVKVFDGCVSFCTTFMCCVINLIGLFPIINNPIAMRVVWECCLCIWAGFFYQHSPLFIVYPYSSHIAWPEQYASAAFVNLIVYAGPLGG